MSKFLIPGFAGISVQFSRMYFAHVFGENNDFFESEYMFVNSALFKLTFIPQKILITTNEIGFYLFQRIIVEIVFFPDERGQMPVSLSITRKCDFRTVCPDSFFIFPVMSVEQLQYIFLMIVCSQESVFDLFRGGISVGKDKPLIDFFDLLFGFFNFAVDSQSFPAFF